MLIGHTIADEVGTLLAVDPQVCEILQRIERELIGVRFETLTHPDDCRRNVAAVSGLKSGAGPSYIRKRYVRPDGSAVWADVQVSRLCEGVSGRLVGTIQVKDLSLQGPGPENLWREAAHEQEAVQRRRREVGNDLFLDYGWLVLLQIYLTEVEGLVATVASISESAAMRPLLVTRWLEVLERKGLVERVPRPDQPSQLTNSGFHKIEYLLERRVLR